ncbi:MAG: CDGSH iron-sulfur domain-containing protein [Marinirhabdus sp.]
MTKVNLIANGPLIVLGEHTVTLEDGTEVVKEKRASYCRCGQSGNFPFCDGRHKDLQQ